MLNYKDVIVGETIYMIETDPVVLEMEVLDKFLKDDEYRLKLKGSDLTFEINYSAIQSDTYLVKEEAEANATKHIFTEVNEIIRTLTENDLSDYYDLELRVQKFKDLYPELFI